MARDRGVYIEKCAKDLLRPHTDREIKSYNQESARKQGEGQRPMIIQEACYPSE